MRGARLSRYPAKVNASLTAENDDPEIGPPPAAYTTPEMVP